MQYAALLPCLISALIGVWISSGMGLAPTAFAVADYAAPTPGNLIRVLLLGLLLAVGLRGFDRVVSCVDLVHLPGGLRVVGVEVGVVFLRQGAVCFFDFVRAGIG